MPRHATVALLILGLAPHLPAQAPPTAITGINMVDVVRAEIHSGQTVIIANGLIQSVGPSGHMDIPAGAVRIPGDGRYLMPGLWDMHVHLRGDQKNPPFVV
jgi:imidazolonepropionase-like amidohydrolase